MSAQRGREFTLDGMTMKREDWCSAYISCALALDAIAIHSLYEVHSLLVDSKYYKQGTKKLMSRMMSYISTYETKRGNLHHSRDYVEDYCYYIVEGLKPRYNKFKVALSKWLQKNKVEDYELLTVVLAAREMLANADLYTKMQEGRFSSAGMSVSSIRQVLQIDPARKLMEDIASGIVASMGKTLAYGSDERIFKLNIDIVHKVLKSRFTSTCERKAAKENKL